jgi:putative sigma-54 modulation protein
VEVVTNVKGMTLICQNESPDMYESINMAAHALNRKLNKYKERRMDGHHGGAAMSDDLMRALDSLDEFNMNDSYDQEQDTFVDPDAVKVTKINSFDLKTPMSQQEAIFALDYIDHDFFVYLSEETNQISVVYKRHLGGVGLIEP